MKAFASLVCLGLALPTELAFANPTPVASRGETLLVSSDANSKVQVKIHTHEVQIGKPSDGRPAVVTSNCTYSRYPCSVVDRIEIVVNGHALFVPRSVFCDLADLNTAEIDVNKRSSVLRIEGGDAAESFILKIEFDAKHIERRTLEGGESGG